MTGGSVRFDWARMRAVANPCPSACTVCNAGAVTNEGGISSLVLVLVLVIVFVVAFVLIVALALAPVLALVLGQVRASERVTSPIGPKSEGV